MMNNSPSISTFPRDSDFTEPARGSVPALFQLQSYAESNVDTALQLPYTERPDAEKSYELHKKIRSVTAMVGILCIVAVVFMLSFYVPDGDETVDEISAQLGLMNFNASTFSAFVTNNNNEEALTFYFGAQINKQQTQLTARHELSSSEIFIFNNDEFRLNLSLISSSPTARCWHVAWSGYSSRDFQDCFALNTAHWYGGAELYDQAWPLEGTNILMSPFLSSDLLSSTKKKNAKFGGVLEPLFINSKGAGFYVDDDVKLHVSINENESKLLCLKSSLVGHDLTVDTSAHSNSPPLRYTVCAADNVKNVLGELRKRFIKTPKQLPSSVVFSNPIWSTWAKFKANVTQSDVTQFVADIVRHNFTASQIEIDDKYSTAYGEFDFDPVKFPNASAMIDDIHANGFAVTFWVYPFANLGSQAFKEGLKYWVGNQDGIPGIVRWWNGLGAVLDVTNPAAITWFNSRLNAFKLKYNVDAFKFDAGEVDYLPKTNFKFAVQQRNLNFFSKLYADLAATFGDRIETRVGYKTQDLGIFTRLLDRSSTWGQDNGLKSVITATLTLGVLGYPYVLPDMIGGNAYVGDPEKELYIRWMQLNAFLPAMQFSIAPWDYDTETIMLGQQVLQLRQSFMPYMLSLASQATVAGDPIIRPLWWHWPDDEYSLMCDTQFMLGDQYLIAPVIERAQFNKTVYLPEGRWQEMFASKKTIDVSHGGTFVHYDVTLSDIPHFKLL